MRNELLGFRASMRPRCRAPAAGVGWPGAGAVRPELGHYGAEVGRFAVAERTGGGAGANDRKLD